MMTNWVKAQTIRFSVALLVASAGFLLLPPAANAAPTASFTFAPTTPLAGEPVTFTFTGTCDLAPCRIIWTWFQAGGSSKGTKMGEGPTIAYAFGDPGSFQVVADITNSGTTHGSAEQTQVVVVNPLPAPSAPRSVSVVPGDERVSVAWLAPASAGTAAITGYTVTASPGGENCTTAGLSCVVTGLTNEQDYRFRVVAQSSDGVSPAATSVPATPLPRAVVKVKAKRGKSALLVNVNPNLKDGSWVFRVQRERKDGTWKSLQKYRTEGAKDRLEINLTKGTYRAFVRAKHDHLAVTSEPVRLKR